MKRMLLVVMLAGALAGCNDPRDTKLPPLSEWASIKPQVEKLPQEERDLLAGYMMRKSLGAAFGGKSPDQEGVTIGQAIEAQKKWKAEQDAAEAEKKAAEAKKQAEREAAMSKMREAVSVTLLGKKLAEDRAAGMVLDEKIEIKVEYKNLSGKDVSGVKGTVKVVDQFGEELSGFAISNDGTIKAGGTAVWEGGRSVRYGMNSDKDRKFAGLEEGKYKVVWEPEMVVFADGSSLKAPE